MYSHVSGGQTFEIKVLAGPHALWRLEGRTRSLFLSGGSRCSLACGHIQSLHLSSHCLLLFSQYLSVHLLLSLDLGPTQITWHDLISRSLLNYMGKDAFFPKSGHIHRIQGLGQGHIFGGPYSTHYSANII